MHNRRKFIQTVGTLAALSPLSSLASATINATQKKNPAILLRSGWQTLNIGDIGHTFGILELFKQYLPGARITLWPSKALDRGVDVLLKKKFPAVQLVSGEVDTKSGQPDSSELKKAFEDNDIFVHSSGPSFLRRKDAQAFHKITGKPFGVYGVSLGPVDEEQLTIINKASFFYTRETASLKYLLSLKPTCPVVGFAPDATFAIDVVDEAQTQQYLKESGLKKGEFICVIPRLRYTPYWQMNKGDFNDYARKRHDVSSFYSETDHQKLREVMIKWVRDTGLKVLVCPEVVYQVDLGKEMLIDPLPEDVKKNVVWRNSYWLPDLAQGVYEQSRALVCFEPHSPIMAIKKGIPSMYLRQPTDTRKGEMWRDIGLDEWIFEIDTVEGSQIYDALKDINNNYSKALKKVGAAQDIIVKRQEISMRQLKKAVLKKIF